MDLQRQATAEMAAQFHHLFVNRRAYTLQSIQAASGNGAPLLFPAESARRAATSGTGLGNVAETPGRRTHARLVFDQSEDSAVKVGGDRRRLQERRRAPAETSI